MSAPKRRTPNVGTERGHAFRNRPGKPQDVIALATEQHFAEDAQAPGPRFDVVAPEQVALQHIDLELAGVEREVAEATEKLEQTKNQLERVQSERRAANTSAQAVLNLLDVERHAAEAAVAEAASSLDAASAEINRLMAERLDAEAAAAAESDRLARVLAKVSRLESERLAAERLASMVSDDDLEPALVAVGQTETEADASAPATGQVSPLEVARAFIAEGNDGSMETAADPAALRSDTRPRFGNALWNSAFAGLSVLAVMAGFTALVDDPSATQAFCAEAPLLDQGAARTSLNALARGATPGDAFSTFKQGQYAYTTTTSVAEPVRVAAKSLESAHAAIANREGTRTSEFRYVVLGENLMNADAALRAACVAAGD